MFVTASDFNLPPYQIPGLDKVANTFTAFIDKVERKYLLEVLGSNLYNAFINGLNALPSSWVSTAPTVVNQLYVYGNNIWKALTIQTGVAPIDGINWQLNEANNLWLLLKNGNTYLYGGKYYQWVGMLEACSPLVYSKWIEAGSVSLTSNGFIVSKTENNDRYDSIEFICSSWNEWSRFVGSSCEQYDTLYGYLYYTNANTGVFDDTFDSTFQNFNEYLSFSFRSQGRKNIFGI